MEGKLLWFNEEKNHGFISTEDGERLYVHGTGFAGGQGIVGRCKGLDVSFGVVDDEVGRRATDVSLLPQVTPRRARRRHR